MTDERGVANGWGVQSDGRELGPGAVIGGYQIEEVVDPGGVGVVYRARQGRPQRTVALKVISPAVAADPDFRRRFEADADAAGSIEHPNLLSIYDVGEQDGVLYVAMPYVEGTDLAHGLARSGAMPPPLAAQVVLQVGSALDAAHAHGLIHRDLRPEAILLSRQDGEHHAYLTPFGLAKQSAEAGQWTSAGTVDYVAPERISGDQVAAPSDVYALGCILYQLLSGRVPFERDSKAATISAHLTEPPPPLGQSLSPFDEVVAKAMAKDPNTRYPSAGELGQAATTAAQTPTPKHSTTAAPAMTPQASPPPAPPAQASPQPAPPPAKAPPQPVAPPPEGPPGGHSQPPQPDDAPVARRRPPRIAVLGGVAALVVAVAAIAVVLLVGSSGKSDPQLIKEAITGYWASVGSNTCNYFSPGALNRDYGGFDACTKAAASAASSPVAIQGAQQVQVNGLNATDTFNAAYHPWKFTLVKQNGRWLIDYRLDLYTEAIDKLIIAWAAASGSNVCNYYSPADIRSYGGVSACQAATATANPPEKVTSAPNVQYRTLTSAVATFSLSNGTHFRIRTSRQPDGSWLIDSVDQVKAAPGS